MSEAKAKTNAEAKAPETKTGAKKQAAEEPTIRYEIGKLRAKSAKLFGISLSTFDGAFYGRTGEYTVDEARSIIDSWLDTPASL